MMNCVKPFSVSLKCLESLEGFEPPLLQVSLSPRLPYYAAR